MWACWRKGSGHSNFLSSCRTDSILLRSSVAGGLLGHAGPSYVMDCGKAHCRFYKGGRGMSAGSGPAFQWLEVILNLAKDPGGRAPRSISAHARSFGTEVPQDDAGREICSCRDDYASRNLSWYLLFGQQADFVVVRRCGSDGGPRGCIPSRAMVWGQTRRAAAAARHKPPSSCSMKITASERALRRSRPLRQRRACSDLGDRGREISGFGRHRYFAARRSENERGDRA